jgi:hypothetical protein
MDLTKEIWASLERGSLCEYRWCDIQGNPVGDPDDACLAYRTSLGWFWGLKTDDEGVEVVVFANTLDSDHHAQSGWDCLPLSCVRELDILKRPAPKKKRSKKPPVPQAAEQEKSNG